MPHESEEGEKPANGKGNNTKKKGLKAKKHKLKQIVQQVEIGELRSANDIDKLRSPSEKSVDVFFESFDRDRSKDRNSSSSNSSS